jgi:arylsulfatase A-like enzyme
LAEEDYPRQFVKGRGFSTNKKHSFRPTTNPYKEMFDYEVASYGIDVIKAKKENDKPYFAAIGLVKPHLPFDRPVEFYDALPEKITPPALLASDLNDIGKEGNSLVPQLLNQSSPVFAPAIARWGRGNYAVRTENWRFIQYFDGTQELYDHQNDNNEWHNLAKLSFILPFACFVFIAYYGLKGYIPQTTKI